MTRRTLLLQSVIAVPLVAVGMPQVQPLTFHPKAFLMAMEPLEMKAGRPRLFSDELEQYVNQFVHDARVSGGIG